MDNKKEDTRDLLPEKIECNRCHNDFEPHNGFITEEGEHVCNECMSSQVVKELDEIKAKEEKEETEKDETV